MPKEARSLAEEEHDSFSAFVGVAPHVAPKMTQAQKARLIALFQRDSPSLDPRRAARTRGIIRALRF